MLMLSNLPASYQASTAVVVDDHPDVLDGIVLQFDDHQRACRGFLKVQDAQKYLNKHAVPKNTVSDHCQIGDGTDTQQFQWQITFDFYKQLFNRNRFQTPRVIISDHDMPTQTGIEFAQALKSQYAVKVILLTGVAALPTAIEAFNHQDIDRFVLKYDAKHWQQLHQYVTELQWLACAEADQGIATALNHSSGAHPLCDPDFIQIFQQLCQEKKIVEFYLLNDSGSFVLLNATGEQSLLVVNTELDFKSFTDLAQDEIDTISPKRLKQLEKRSHVVWIVPEQDCIPYVKDWQWFECKQLPNKPIWYAWVNQGLPKHLLSKSILSYQDTVDKKQKRPLSSPVESQ